MYDGVRHGVGTYIEHSWENKVPPLCFTPRPEVVHHPFPLPSSLFLRGASCPLAGRGPISPVVPGMTGEALRRRVSPYGSGFAHGRSGRESFSPISSSGRGGGSRVVIGGNAGFTCSLPSQRGKACLLSLLLPRCAALALAALGRALRHGVAGGLVR